jgi:hypothetical protein
VSIFTKVGNVYWRYVKVWYTAFHSDRTVNVGIADGEVFNPLCAAQLFEELRYKPEGCGFDSRWVIGIFHGHNPSCRTLALGLTLTEINTRNVSWVKGGRCVGLTTLPPSWILGATTSWYPQGLSSPVMGLLYLYLYLYCLQYGFQFSQFSGNADFCARFVYQILSETEKNIKKWA